MPGRTAVARVPRKTAVSRGAGVRTAETGSAAVTRKAQIARESRSPGVSAVPAISREARIRAAEPRGSAQTRSPAIARSPGQRAAEPRVAAIAGICPAKTAITRGPAETRRTVSHFSISLQVGNLDKNSQCSKFKGRGSKTFKRTRRQGEFGIISKSKEEGKPWPN
jgi:hypothetical protein